MPQNAPDLPDGLWSHASRIIADRLGLDFPRERRGDLERGLQEAATDLGLPHVSACLGQLVSGTFTQAQFQVLAKYLTIGETYFFRDKRLFDVLAETILPEIILARREKDRDLRLRIWSAGCGTGEEPYSIGILLKQVIPDLGKWNVTILGTDINERFLQIAKAGTYRDWSFRETKPAFRERYFHPSEDNRHSLLSEIKGYVTLAQLNLVEDVYPSVTNDTNAMDLILCRNVLKYFTAAQAGNVLRKLHQAVCDDGWLVVSSGEVAEGLMSYFTPVNFHGTILYRKRENSTSVSPTNLPESRRESIARSVPGAAAPGSALEAIRGRLSADKSGHTSMTQEAPRSKRQQGLAMAQIFYEEGRFAEAAVALQPSHDPMDSSESSDRFSLLTRSLANEGRLADALACCNTWVAEAKLNSSAHYLRGMVLQELGDPAQARRALQKAIYVDPDFVLAHFALANLSRRGGQIAESERHFTNALELLGRYSLSDLIPESDGLTALRLKEMICWMMTPENR